MKKKDAERYEISRRDLMRGGAVVAGAAMVHSAGFAATESIADVMDLRADGLVDPLGLVKPPRLTWTDAPGAFAKEYELEVFNEDKKSRAVPWVRRTASAFFEGLPSAMAHAEMRWRVRAVQVNGAKSAWREARFQYGPLNASDWSNAKWIGRDVQLEGTQGKMAGAPGPVAEPAHIAAPHLRREFEVREGLKSAYLYISGLGFAEVHVNGARVDETRERDPGYTNFSQRVLYVTHDVTAKLKTGANALGVILGTGWYDVHDVATWHYNTAQWRERPRMMATMVLKYADGSSQTVVSDERWKTATGPILRDGIYTGEVYDARLELPGWASASFDAAKWKKALVVAAPRGTVEPLMCEPIRINETIAPKSITQPTPGVWVVDLGQNIAGHARLRVTAPAGSAITMRYSEKLGDDGNIDTHRIDHFMQETKPRQPFQQDTYICKGGGEEVWEQRFSYSGFQYIEVTGFSGTLTPKNIEGRVANTAIESASEFSCSDAIVNAVHRATLWSYRANAQSIPTDCPHREKNGWTGDAGLAAECGLMNFHSAAFYEKWLEDFRRSQREDGGFPVIIPNGGWGNGEAWPGGLVYAWDAAYPVLLWKKYRYTGNANGIAAHLPGLMRYMEYLVEAQTEKGLPAAVGLGDWEPFKTVTSLEFINAAYQWLVFDLCEKLGLAAQNVAIHSKAKELRAATGDAIQKHLYDAANFSYAGGTQCAQAMALHFGFCPEDQREGVTKVLVDDIKRQGHLDVGVLGATALFRALSENGHTDLAFAIAMRKEGPSYADWIARGATTLWEDWPGGASRNHIMFGDISPWFQSWIAGLQIAETGWSEIAFKPHAVGGVTEAKCSHLTPYGKAGIAWKLEGMRMLLELEVPRGTKATLFAQPGAKVNGRSTFTAGSHRAVILLS